MNQALKRSLLLACLILLAAPATALGRGFLPSLPGPRQLAALKRGPVLVQLRPGVPAPLGAEAVAPGDGQGLVGIYPQAVLQSWDASASFGEGASVDQEIAGLDAAAKRGPGVANISLGSEQRSTLEEEAVMAAFGAGVVVVASAG